MVYQLLVAAIATACSGASKNGDGGNERTTGLEPVAGVPNGPQLNAEGLWKEALQYVPNEISLTFGEHIEYPDLASVLDVRQARAKLAIGLVLLKQYNYHLTCCNQSYNLLDQKNPNDSLIVTWFVQFASCSIGNKMFIPSSCAYEWMNAQPEALSNEHVRLLLKEVEENIDRLKP